MKRQKKRSIIFRQWSGKSFAIFNSLKKVMKICVLSVAYSFVFINQDANAQTDTTTIQKTTEIESVEISGQRTPVVASQLSRIVTVVSRKDVERAPVQNVNDLLKYVPQVDIRQRGVNGVQADVSIQGGSYDQTLILLNGINLTDPQTGHHNLNLPLEIECIDRIEILKGGASRVFGTNAFSGAINFITGQDTQNHAKASLSIGDFGFMHTGLSVNQHTSKYNNFISASHINSNGYIHNTGFDGSNAFFHGKRYVNNGFVGMQLGITKKAFGSNSFYSPKNPDQFESTDTYFGALNAELGIKLKISPNIYWRRNYDDYILIHDKPTTYQNFHFTDAFGGGINISNLESWGKTTIGIDLRKEIIHSNNLGLKTNDSIKVKGQNGQDNYYYNLSDSRKNASFYLEQNFHFGNFGASGGAMINYNSTLSRLKIYPGMDLSYRFIPELKLFASINNALRLPSYTDLYYHGPNNQGNKDLKPETATTFETGFIFIKNGLQAHISYFNRNANNVIDWVKYSNSDIWHTVNHTKIIANGMEFAANLNPSEFLKKKSILKDITLSHSLTRETKDTLNAISNYALDYLKEKFTVGATFEIEDRFGITFNYTYQQRNGSYLKYDMASNTSSNMAYNAFSLFDGKLYGQFNMIKIFVDATNILDVKYIDYGNIRQPGRWFKVGAEFNVNWK